MKHSLKAQPDTQISLTMLIQDKEHVIQEDLLHIVQHKLTTHLNIINYI